MIADVPIWLKRLRLHKYNGIIADLTYTELMNLNEGQLDKMGVTKGARFVKKKFLKKGVSRAREERKELRCTEQTGSV